MRLVPGRPFANHLAAPLAALLLGALAAGCGLLSSDEAPLPGVYESDEFRVERDGGTVDDVEGDGAVLEMTLTEDRRVVNGRLVVPQGEDEETFAFTGTYERDGDRVAFDFEGDALAEDYFNTGTPLSEVEWIFYDQNDARLGADAESYVLFLDREGDVPEASANE